MSGIRPNPQEEAPPRGAGLSLRVSQIGPAAGPCGQIISGKPPTQRRATKLVAQRAAQKKPRYLAGLRFHRVGLPLRQRQTHQYNTTAGCAARGKLAPIIGRSREGSPSDSR